MVKKYVLCGVPAVVTRPGQCPRATRWAVHWSGTFAQISNGSCHLVLRHLLLHRHRELLLGLRGYAARVVEFLLLLRHVDGRGRHRGVVGHGFLWRIVVDGVLGVRTLKSTE